MYPNGGTTPQPASGIYSLLSSPTEEESVGYRYQQVSPLQSSEAETRIAYANEGPNKRLKAADNVTRYSHGGSASKENDNVQIASILTRLSNVEQELDVLKNVPRAGSIAPDIASARSLLVPALQGIAKDYNETNAAPQSGLTPIYDDRYNQNNNDVMQSLSLRRDLSHPENPPFGIFWTYTVEETLLWPILGYHGSVNSSLDALFANSDSEDQPSVGDSLVSRSAAHPNVNGIQSGLDDGAVIQELTESFLKNVHVKSPILDPSELRSRAANVAENGLNWDEETCQVVSMLVTWLEDPD